MTNFRFTIDSTPQALQSLGLSLQIDFEPADQEQKRLKTSPNILPKIASTVCRRPSEQDRAADDVALMVVRHRYETLVGRFVDPCE
jgi:hypothetical protein